MNRLTLRNLIFWVSLLICASGCTSDEVKIQRIAQDFASLECRAIELRKSRFALADTIRFAEDSLILLQEDSSIIAGINLRMKGYEQRKNDLVKTSLSLAEHIRDHLDSLMSNELSKPDHRKLFDAALENALKERGCQ